MKLIALRNFRNVQGLELDGNSALNERHVHKGATFSIGGNKDFKDLSKSDQRAILELNAANCIGDATDEKLAKRIQKEAAIERDSETRAATTAVAAGSPADMVRILSEAGFTVKPPKPEKA